MMKTYSHLKTLYSFEDKFEYLKIKGLVGFDTFGFDRWINQHFYMSKEWKQVRTHVINRDMACDLGDPEREIRGKIIVHHINPIRLEDFENSTNLLLDPENLITVSDITHNAIHYGDINLIPKDYIPRTKNDTIPWR